MILSLEDRIEVLAKLRTMLVADNGLPEQLLQQTKAFNPWFTFDAIKQSLAAIQNLYLDEAKLKAWTTDVKLEEISPKKIGLILAGNIPLVGFHDIISVFIAGHIAQIKLSQKDTLLTNYLLSKLNEIDPATTKHFELVERLVDYDAVIATGSNTTGKYFEKYFSKVPHIIRKNRNGVAVIYNDTTDEELTQLGIDIFSFFGLGCRNVSKIYVEQGVELPKIFDALAGYKGVTNHNKYMNNYDYAYALYLMNQEDFLTNDYLILRPNSDISSRIAVVHYEYFTDQNNLEEELKAKHDQIQCIISGKPLSDMKVFDYGKAQYPQLDDYADGVNTLEFLRIL